MNLTSTIKSVRKLVNGSAGILDSLSFREALDRNLQVMDRTAFTLCMENQMPIMVFDMFLAGNMERAVRGESIGTWVI